ncbi:SigB/SigF/SigG family RNA polymerase sigma factor [Dactylosporangium matsuzakiense]|uniref:RNA polymerase sigma-B factor n=1 Tax=Dactylosporangium matsuzakiense TaxID=53360 RepID=A0A9W6NNG0_9ACTN|nr:SigB/SigF/SigG family RNA polymerase sigma factor [Dactylosporangium matsuzakiense]UWZ44164.1 SigB/SigF/SigG family RNA polymerase sigma factor [Dactylosporangium matsuzakiense]GLL03404.1 hypothetical protein GCM10017581_051490 [Dactylosporangium matsuzakiense]
MSTTVHRAADVIIRTRGAAAAAGGAARAEPAPGGPALGARQAAWRQTDDLAWSLLNQLAGLAPDHDGRPRLRARVIELYLPLARHVAQRFRNRGEPFDDLVQVANLALIKAVDRFTVTYGVHFPAYAIPVITGELKRHFRDKCWAVRVPRRAQEAWLSISTVVEGLTHDLGRSPTVNDIATCLHLSEEAVIEGLEAGRGYRTVSLSAAPSGGNTTLGDMIGDDDRDLDQVEVRHALRPLLARLPQREQRIVALRFFGNRTQSQIAAELGLSQMHVSRLLRKSLQTLRRGLITED